MAKKPSVVKDIQVLERLVVIKVPILSITPNTYNPNRQSDRDFELLCRSIEEDGFTQPILVHRETNQIVDGEHRWRALQALGKTECEIVYVDMSEAQRRVATLRHNRARGNEDINMASDVMRQLQNLDGLDNAADALMLDAIDLEILLEDIPSSELILRAPDKQMTIEETKETLRKEQSFLIEKSAEETAIGLRDDSITSSYTLMIFAGELRLIKEVCGKTDTASGIIALLRKYQHDPIAREYMTFHNQEPLPFAEEQVVQEIFLD